jgi:hypothetical protein
VTITQTKVMLMIQTVEKTAMGKMISIACSQAPVALDYEKP